MKFLVDKPLESLAKWLRFSGFDAESLSLSAAAAQGLPPPAPDTYLLTRNASLKKLGRPDLLVLSAAGLEEQLQEVFGRLKISRRDLNPLNRCGRCNETLTPMSRDAVQGQVPDHVFMTQKEFYQCPACRRVYWPGSHLPGIGRTLSRVLRPAAKARSGKQNHKEKPGP